MQKLHLAINFEVMTELLMENILRKEKYIFNLKRYSEAYLQLQYLCALVYSIS